VGIFFTSDQHFGHANVIKFCNRPFKDVDDMQERLIENHNSVVRPGDLVYMLGDMFWRTTSLERALMIKIRLNGQHYYINGNHEELFKNKSLRDQFIWIKERETIHPAGYQYIVLDHFAGKVWNKSHSGSYQLYGHSHNELDKNPDTSLLSCDVGVDSWDYKPVSIEQVKEKMDKRLAAREASRLICPECSRTFYSITQTDKLCADCGVTMKSVLVQQ
jgi:calcineurin-like phosphoesterase family protein